MCTVCAVHEFCMLKKMFKKKGFLGTFDMVYVWWDKRVSMLMLTER